MVSWLQILVAWLVWAGALDQVPAGGEAESPPVSITLASGKKFAVTFRATRVA